MAALFFFELVKLPISKPTGSHPCGAEIAHHGLVLPRGHTVARESHGPSGVHVSNEREHHGDYYGRNQGAVVPGRAWRLELEVGKKLHLTTPG